MEQTKTKKRNWEEISIEADTMITYELLQACKEGDFKGVQEGLEVYHKACIGGARHELWKNLHCLMEDVMLAKLSDKYHTQKHWEKITKWRSEIEDQMDYDDFISEKNIKEEWSDAFKSGRKIAAIFVPKAKEIKELTWNEVLEHSYHPNNYGK